jgi:hypothetical protein
LRLNHAERAYLFRLAGRIDVNETSSCEHEYGRSMVEASISSISQPAYVIDKYWNPVFWNTESAKLFPFWLEGSESNLLRHMFLDPKARTFVVDWERRARQLAAQFRIDFINNLDDPKTLELLKQLDRESGTFQSIWEDQQVLFPDTSDKTYDHPQYGLIKVSHTTFLAASEPGLKLVILTLRG